MPRKQSINGEREITLSFLRGDINDKFIADIETGWTANFKGDKYHLFNEREDQHGNKEFDAVLDFFHHFNGRWHVDEVEDKSMTINDSIRPLFDNSDYVLQIIDNFYANTMSLSKQQNSTERFIYFIGRHNAEFNIPIGTQTVQIRNKIGVQRNDVLIHEDDNLVDFNITTDTGSFCTAIKGYYRFRVPAGSGDSTEKEPTRTYDYISPMASKYGVIWGEPIHDERFDTLEGIQAATKQKQESTWKSSFEIAAERFDTPLNIGDEVRFIVPSKSINGYIRVVEINEQFDEEGELIEATYTFGNENIANQYRKMQYDAIQDISDIMLGKKPIPYSVLPKAVREATNVINAGESSSFEYRRNGIYGFNTEYPLGVTRYNANGIGFSRDGGQTFNNAMTYLGIVADAITAGTIDANNVNIYGDEGYNRIEVDGSKIKVWDSRDSDEYTIINNGSVEARGKHQRTWLGQTSTHDVSLRFEHGYIRARNNSLGRSLYFSDYGISTYADGEGNNDASGSLLFRDPEFSNAAGGGLTVHSTYGAVALKSEYSRAVILAEDTVNLESEKYSVYVRPFKDTRNGLNEFQFYVKDNPSTSETDGALLYGNLTGGATHGSGIRFSKQSGNPKIYATNNNGDIGTGGLHAKEVQAESIRVLDEGGNLYLGTSTGEVRVTNNLLYNGGDIGYRPIKASAFTQSSSESYKTNIKEVEDIGLATIKELSVVEYDLKDDIEEGITDNRQIGLIAEKSAPVATKDLTGIDLYKMNSYSIKAIQELLKRVEKLEGA